MTAGTYCGWRSSKGDLSSGTTGKEDVGSQEESSPSREHPSPLTLPEATWDQKPPLSDPVEPPPPTFQLVNLAESAGPALGFHAQMHFLAPWGTHFASGELAESG